MPTSRPADDRTVMSLVWHSRLPCLITAFLLFCSGCVPTFKQDFPKEYNEYMEEPEQKALAYVLGGNGGYAYGYSSGKKTVEEAINGAMEQCKNRRTLYEVKGKCEIEMINDQKAEEYRKAQN